MTTDDDHPDVTIPAADHVSWTICSHGTLFLLAHDQDGTPIVCAAFQNSREFLAEIQKSVDGWQAGLRGAVN